MQRIALFSSLVSLASFKCVSLIVQGILCIQEYTTKQSFNQMCVFGDIIDKRIQILVWLQFTVWMQ